ncbi:MULTISPECIES: hypothetical protein [Haloferax]|uniref:Uncharacterized protein n=1 Tax=Haloferax marinum TaxID=2666143 RepID=A0A6A8G7Y1_9EURY|nr:MULTISPECIES: hypothetical protein [Haloferax]KAB1198294.1 hypothetical protein Hfx1150_12540 [Haloferax sp. CBA1150]MRW97390.1 hypothetical protein [Haloferax marinum]
MSRGYSTTPHTPRRHSAFTPYLLVVVGLVTFCLAVFAPIADLSAGPSLVNVATSGSTPMLDGRTLVVSGGLVLISTAATLFGLLLLLIRLK